jgi:O-antigen ligase
VSPTAAPTERSHSLLELAIGATGGEGPAPAPQGDGRPPRAREALRAALRADWLWPTLLVAAILSFLAFSAGGGLSLASMTTAEIALTLGSAIVVVAALVFARERGRSSGSWPLALLIALTALSALSVIWSVSPDASYRDADRMLAYVAVFGVSIVLARTVPARWSAIIGGVTLAAVIVCGYALLTKVFPDQLDAGEKLARLRAPYSYWNATGLTAAMGALGCMWLGARRDGHALLRASSYPAMALMLTTLMLAYSRGAIVALVVGLALWFAIVPLRLRGASVLIGGALGAGAVVAFDFSTHALSSDGVALAARTSAGHQLGVLLAAVLLLLALAGAAVGFTTGRRAPTAAARARAGAALLAVLALTAIAAAGALAASHRGLTGSISHAVNTLTDPHAPVPSNTPGRLTAVGSVRARYWNEALEAFEAHPALGVGAEGYATARLRYRAETLDVRHAHGFLVQTLADLGLVGLGLSLCLLGAWLTAASRCARPLDERSRDAFARLRGGALPRPRAAAAAGGGSYTPERVAMLGMFTVVVCFGAHSLADWTWYVPGNACAALLCAGWLAGRGPLRTSAAAEPPSGAAPPQAAEQPSGAIVPSSRPVTGTWRMRRDARTLAIAATVVAASLVAAWAQWQPQRSEDAREQALTLLASSPHAARARAEDAAAIDPLSMQALFTLSRTQLVAGEAALARATLARAVRLQPSNPQTWLALGESDLARDPRSALNELSAAIYLDPMSIAPELIARGSPQAIAIENDYVAALRASGR